MRRAICSAARMPSMAGNTVQRAGGCADHMVVYRGLPFPSGDDGIRAERGSGPENGAEIMGIPEAVEQHI